MSSPARPVRVTVTGETRRVDVAVPGAVPVAELVPELARGLGLLDAHTAHRGYDLMTHDGVVLEAGRGLTAQGIGDDAVLAVSVVGDAGRPPAHDDTEEAIREVAERQIPGVDVASLRRALLACAAVLLVAGACSLPLLDLGTFAAALGATTAAALVALGIGCSRRGVPAELPVTLCLVGGSYAGAVGLDLGGGLPLTSAGSALTGAAVLGAGGAAVIGVVTDRALLMPPVVVGVALLAVGIASRATAVQPASLLTAALVLLALVGHGAAGSVVLARGSPRSEETGPVDLAALSADVHLAHQLELGTSLSLGVLLVLVAPFAATLGGAGDVVELLACLVVLLRARRLRSGTDALIGVVAGVLGLTSTAVSLLWLQPGARAAVGLALPATGLLLLATALRPGTPSLAGARAADLAEGVVLVSVLPALVVATGLADQVQRWVGR